MIFLPTSITKSYTQSLWDHLSRTRPADLYRHQQWPIQQKGGR